MHRIYPLPLILAISCAFAFGQGVSQPDTRTIRSPEGGKVAYVIELPQKPVLLRVDDRDGQVLFQYQMGYRASVRPFWSKDGKYLAVITDYSYGDADLRAPRVMMPDYIFILDGSTGEVLAEANGDDVLALKQRAPDMVSAARDTTISFQGARAIVSSYFQSADLHLQGTIPISENRE